MEFCVDPCRLLCKRAWVVTLFVIAMFAAPTPAVAANCNPNDNLDETAESFISRCIKGRVNDVFPDEHRGKTLRELKGGSTSSERKAWKLVSRKEYNKYSSVAVVDPSHQEIYGTSGDAHWTITQDQDPLYEETLVIDFGDGSTSTVTVPQGSGTVSFAVSHRYSVDWYPLDEFDTFSTTYDISVYIAGGEIDGQALPDGDPAKATVHQCA